MPAKVYFSREITPEKVLELYKLTGKALPGNVAIKVHSGEKGNQNFLKPDFWKAVIDHVGGTVVECTWTIRSAMSSPPFRLSPPADGHPGPCCAAMNWVCW